MRIEMNALIFPPQPGVQCHASHLLPLSDGGVLSVWFQGTREGAEDVCIWGARLSPDGSWSVPVRLSQDDGQPHWNPVLFRRADGAVMLFYKAGAPIARWRTLLMISTDEGRSFSSAHELVPGDLGGRGPVRSKPLRLSDGSLLAPASLEDGPWRCFMDRSFDEGRTWQRTADLRLSGPSADAPVPYGIIQPTLWEDDAHAVHALMRSTQGLLYRTDSADGGRTFCAPYPTPLLNNNSGIDLARSDDGTLYLVCNPVGANWGSRSPLSILCSRDNGETWQFFTHLVTEPGEFSYPSVVFSDGCLHITHTCQRRAIRYWRARL